MKFLSLIKEEDVKKIVHDAVEQAVGEFGNKVIYALKDREVLDHLIEDASRRGVQWYINSGKADKGISWRLQEYEFDDSYSIVNITGRFLAPKNSVKFEMDDEQFMDVVKNSIPLNYDLVSTVLRLDRRYSEILNIAGKLEARLAEMEKSVVILENVERHRIKFENKLNLVAVGRTYATSEVGISIKGLVFLDDVQNTVKIMTWNGHVSICNDVFEYKPGVTEEDILSLFKNGQFKLSRLTTFIASWLGVSYEKFQQDSDLGKILLDGRNAIELFFVSPRVGV